MITFFSLGDKGYQVLSTLPLSILPMIDLVVIGADKGVDNDFSIELIDWCIQSQIDFVKRSEFNSKFQTSKYWIMIGWRWMVKPAHDCQLIVLHDSLLPKFRGFNPLVTALIEGETQIGATAIFGNAEFDRGEIILQKSVTIQYPMKIQDAIQLMAELYKGIICEIMTLLADNKPLKSVPQINLDASYSLWRDEEDYRINWNQDADKIIRHIHACGKPYKGAYTTYNGDKFRVLDGEKFEDVQIANRTPGKVIFKVEGFPVVVCGNGLILLKEILNENGVFVKFSNFRIRLI